jgi:hypothetical protein
MEEETCPIFQNHTMQNSRLVYTMSDYLMRIKYWHRDISNTL